VEVDLWAELGIVVEVDNPELGRKQVGVYPQSSVAADTAEMTEEVAAAAVAVE